MVEEVVLLSEQRYLQAMCESARQGVFIELQQIEGQQIGTGKAAG
jgi:hypothetical protein